jgi:hypothetical protein
MPMYSAGAVRLESGLAGAMMPIERATSVGINYSIPRASVGVLNRGKPLNQRPVINYTPVDVSIDFYKSNSDIEAALGLLNSSNVTTNLVEARSGVSTAAIRDIHVLFAPTNSTNYNGALYVSDAVLTSYAVQGSIGEPVRGSIGFQGLEMSGAVNTTSRDSTNYVAALVKPENIALTGIQFTGVGLTGTNIQSFSFSLGIGRTQVQQLGQRFPSERPLTDVSASMQIQGFFEGVNNSLTSLGNFNCGDPFDGQVKLTMTPSCSTAGATNIEIIRPYFESFSVEGQAGGFSTFSLSLSAPIGPNPNETTDGSVVKIT